MRTQEWRVTHAEPLCIDYLLPGGASEQLAASGAAVQVAAVA